MSNISRLCSEYMDSELPEDVRLNLQKLMQEDTTIMSELERLQTVQERLEKMPIPNCNVMKSRVWQNICAKVKERKKTLHILPIPVFASLFIILLVLPYLTNQVGFMAEYWQTSSNNILADMQTFSSEEESVFIDDLVIQDNFQDLINRLRADTLPSNVMTLPSSTQFNIKGAPLLIPIRNIAIDQ